MPHASHWTDLPHDDQDRINALVDSARPVVPASGRGGFLAERWIAERPCVVQSFMSLTALIVGVRFEGLLYAYDAKYLYEDEVDALLALRDWTGRCDPPGPWIRELKTEREGPGNFNGAHLHR